MLERTLFYSLEPLGIGTLQVEGLRSYVQRLAAAHSTPPRALLGTLLARFPFGSDMQASPAEVMRALVSYGSGRLIAEVTKRLELATGQSLEACTLERFGGLLAPQGFSRLQDPKYCPSCVQEDPRCHGHLAWDVGCVNVCPLHNVCLLSAKHCGAPNEEHLVLQQRPFLPSVCNQCGSVGFRCVVHDATPATAEQSWTAAAVAGAVAMSTEARGRCNAASVIAGLQMLVDTAYGGSSVRASLTAGLSRPSVGQWLLGRGKPSLTGLLRLCQGANCELSAVLQGDFQAVEVDRVPLDAPTTRQYRASHVTTDELRSRLAEALNVRPAPTVAEFARQNSTSARWVRKLFPEEAGKLAEMGKIQREMERAQAYEEALATYKNAAEELISRGKRVSPKNVEKLSGLVAFSSNTKRRHALLAAVTGAAENRHQGSANGTS